MRHVKVLFVDRHPDEHAVMRVLAGRSSVPRLAVTSTFDLESALDLVPDHDVVIVGDHGDDRSGLSMLESARRNHPSVPIIYLTDVEHGDLTTAALKAGAVDIVPRSVLSSEMLLRSITFAIEHAASSRRISEHHNRTMALIQALPDVVLRLDKGGTILDTFGDLRPAGTPLPDQGEVQTVADVLPSAAIIPLNAAVAQALFTGELSIAEFDLEPDVEVEARVSPIDDTDQVVVVIRDTTNRNRQRRRLLDLVESKDEMLADVAHELRNPLTAVVGFAQLLTAQRENFSEDEVRDMLNRILAQANDIQGLVEDLLTAARREIGKLAVVSVRTSLNAQVAQIMESLPEHQAERLTIVRGPGICQADPSRVRQICRNLISNAIRYGGPDIRVTTGKSAAAAYVEVSDDGPGVSPDRLDRLFVRHESSDDHDESIGLGLALSRDLAQLMRGDISYERRSDRTIFRLTLPVCDASRVGVHGLDVGGVLVEDNPPFQLQ